MRCLDIGPSSPPPACRCSLVLFSPPPALPRRGRDISAAAPARNVLRPEDGGLSHVLRSARPRLTLGQRRHARHARLVFPSCALNTCRDAS